ncbi:MAG: Unknown protein [uncultured Sulfurovum sp.]|uniref:Uncharacterized protein n=1 Tax=uncultured Sulfurovum sp. TaxID=269237 RepID=A0A6S6SAV3_9BACT|nr:MAG: Unknown protein [uncultured Sulfurovum sp.]
MDDATKLNYLLNKHYMSGVEIIHAFGFKTSSMITNMRTGKSNIATVHKEALERHFEIPTIIFDESITTKNEIKKQIESYRKTLKHAKQKKELQEKILQKLEEAELIPKDIFNKNFQKRGALDSYIREHKTMLLKQSDSKEEPKFSNPIFPKNEKLFEKLKGIWYGYVYPSNPASAEHGIWEVKTIIGDDYSVVDQPWGNKGYLKLGKNESLIIKESYDHDDLTTIRFSNRQVPSEHFRFVVISNQNHTLNEMVNFGFFSRKRYPLEEAKEILGDRESKQLKLDIAFNERLTQKAVVPQ